MSELNVGIEERGEVVVARLSGELDIASVRDVEEAVGPALGRDVRGVVVDCSELTFMDSSGVTMLFALSRQLQGHRQELHVVAPRGATVARVLELVDFGRAAPVHTTLEDALGSLGGDGA